jgi:uncharacterized membrane protein
MNHLTKNHTIMFTAPDIILLCTAFTTALITGLFYAYSCSVNPGLGQLPADGFIPAMQSINKAIQNPVFFLSFLGTAVLLPVCTYMHYHVPLTAKFYLLLAAAIVYLAGVMGITIFGNIPLNDALDKFNTATADAAEMARQKITFAKQWNRFHTIRTIASCISLLFVLIACIYKETK